jgi:hypothetical protein
MGIIVELVYFLDRSGDNVVDLDSAVAELESVAASLGTLSLADREAFVLHVGRMLEEERAAGVGTDRLRFLESLPQDLGLVASS